MLINPSIEDYQMRCSAAGPIWYSNRALLITREERQFCRSLLTSAGALISHIFMLARSCDKVSQPIGVCRLAELNETLWNGSIMMVMMSQTVEWINIFISNLFVDSDELGCLSYWLFYCCLILRSRCLTYNCTHFQQKKCVNVNNLVAWIHSQLPLGYAKGRQ